MGWAINLLNWNLILWICSLWSSKLIETRCWSCMRLPDCCREYRPRPCRVVNSPVPCRAPTTLRHRGNYSARAIDPFGTSPRRTSIGWCKGKPTCPHTSCWTLHLHSSRNCGQCTWHIGHGSPVAGRRAGSGCSKHRHRCRWSRWRCGWSRFRSSSQHLKHAPPKATNIRHRER